MIVEVILQSLPCVVKHQKRFGDVVKVQVGEADHSELPQMPENWSDLEHSGAERAALGCAELR